MILLLAASVALAGCNLGQQTPSEPLTVPPGQEGLSPQDIESGDLGELAQTTTPGIMAPATNTPPPELLVTEQLGPVTIPEGTKRVESPMTIRVQAGTQVSSISCTVVHQETNQTFPLGTPVQNPVDENSVSNSYTFTPQLAGTYAVNCTGVATTTAGQRSVSAVSNVFNVEAKG